VRQSMVDFVKKVNSKRFLISYLIIVVLMLLVLSQRYDSVVPEKRDIPEDMKPYLVSPIRLISDFTLQTNDQRIINNEYFLGKWSFVYFSHSRCLPQCSSALTVLEGLKQVFGERLFNYLLIDIDDKQSSSSLAEMLAFQGYSAFTIAEADIDTTAILARSFIALFLKSPLPDGDYLIEQEHHVFLVDPKGRVYARFKPPYSDVQAKILKTRFFYNKTEH
jgi:cytochrome oxidase Cu insertion factor (SCO1/SenC/PrrC family)